MSCTTNEISNESPNKDEFQKVGVNVQRGYDPGSAVVSKGGSGFNNALLRIKRTPCDLVCSDCSLQAK